MKVNGYGIGYRPQHFAALSQQKSAELPQWIEVLSENFMGSGGMPRRNLLRLRESLPVCLHGVSMSIAGQDPFSDVYLKDLKAFVDLVQPVHVSDHLCWTSLGGHNSHDLLPVPYTEAMLDHVCSRIQWVQDYLGRPLLFENPSAYVAFGADAVPESEFLAEMCRRTGCGLILDVNNLYVNHKNLGVDVFAWLSRINSSTIGYMHVAGHSVADLIRVDTHDAHVSEDVWDLYAFVNQSFGTLPAMVEWDDHIPEFSELLKEAALLATHAKRNVGTEQLVRQMPSQEHSSFRKESQDWRQIQEDFFRSVVTKVPLSTDLLRSDAPAPAHVGLDVYSYAYSARLISVFSDAFPVLLHVIGRSHFNEMMERYLGWRKPNHYSAKFAAECLSEYPGVAETSAKTGINETLLRNLIAFEWCLYHLRDVPGSEGQLTRAHLATIQEDQWPTVRFSFHPAIALMTVSYRVDLVMTDYVATGAPQMPEQERVNIFAYRDGDEVSWVLLDEGHFFLAQAIQKGLSFESCCHEAHERRTDDQGLETTIAEAVAVVGDWLDLGVIAGILTDS